MLKIIKLLNEMKEKKIIQEYGISGLMSKIDMNHGAINKRLEKVARLRELCLSLKKCLLFYVQARQIEVALREIQMGITDEQISSLTGLEIKEIQSLRK